MNWAKKGIIGMLAFSLLLAPQVVLGGPPGSKHPPPGITKNRPQVLSSEEVPFDGAARGGTQSALSKTKLFWIAVGTVIVTGLVLGASGGGGGDSGSSNGSISVKW